jgi:hypothetical protein
MKTQCAIAILSATALLSGCADSQHNLVLESVGPPIVQRQMPNTDGILVVYSAYDVTGPGISNHHSDYKIFAGDGKPLQIVHNHNVGLYEDPASVELSPGTYRVVAKADSYGIVTVPVVVKANQVTTVHLERGGSWPNESIFSQTNSVRLPDGQIVGWRASE